MSAIPPVADPGDIPAPDATAIAPSRRRSKTRGRLIILAVVLVCLVGAGGYFKWKAVHDESDTQNAREALAADGIAVIEAAGEADESGSPFQGFAASKMVRVQSNNNHITDAELPKIAAINQDLNLVLSFCPITNQGLSQLVGKTNIRCLALTSTGVTDDGIKYLRGMRLLSLDLSSTKITNAGLAELSEFDFPKLRELAIERTSITDAGLMHLAAFKKLEWITVSGTKVTRDGVRRLKAKLPEVTVLGAGG